MSKRSFFKIWLCRGVKKGIKLLDRFEKRICYKKEQVIKIEKGVQKIMQNAQVAESFKAQVPNLQMLYNTLKEKNATCEQDRTILIGIIKELYVLDIENSRQERFKIYERIFGKI